MELPRPPAWYRDDDLVPPRPPKNKKLRSFGSPDEDDSFWEAERPVAEHCAVIKRLNREAVRCFCELLRLAASSEAFDAEQQVESKGEALQKLFDEMHSEVGKLRIPEARSNLKQHLEEEARQRRATASRLRAAAADARQQIKDMLAGPDAPPYTDHEESEEAVVERAVLISDRIRAHEAAEHARLCLEGKAPPEERSLDLDEPESLEDGLTGERDGAHGGDGAMPSRARVAAEAQDEGRRERAARRRQWLGA